ncbi:MAG TPA: VWA domain-containing protein [Candidatus Polarisedimenticolia bacterium]|nr:VWA domain-containing protein [Candidatus Polarisedimenticolia bacterium]
MVLVIGGRLVAPGHHCFRGIAAVAGTPTLTPPSPVTDPLADGGPVTVRFVEPAPPGLVLGETRLTVEAATSPDARIVRVEIYADDALLSAFENPPYALTWNAGSSFLRRVLKAVAIDSAGRRAETTLVARPLLIGQREEVRLVNVYATVRDRKGEPVLDLARDDFTLLEDGVPQTISHFTSARVPLTVALLIDASNSMNLGGKIEMARKAAIDFLESVDRDDRLLVLPFNDELRGLKEPSSDRRRLREAIEAIRAEGGTALYDALYRTADLLTAAEGRRAILLLSDGRDQALTENEPGSLHLFEEALQKAHRAEVAVYTVGLGHHLENEMDLQYTRSLADILETLARETGGRSYYPERAGQLSRIYTEVASDLKRQYALAYASTNRTRDGGWRSITLRVRRSGLEVQARRGYYAPGPGTP